MYSLDQTQPYIQMDAEKGPLFGFKFAPAKLESALGNELQSGSLSSGAFESTRDLFLGSLGLTQVEPWVDFL